MGTGFRFSAESQEQADILVARINACDEAIDLLKAVIEDGKVSDVLWNHIQAALKKWGEA